MDKLLKYLNKYEIERVRTGKGKKALFWSENYARKKYEKFIVKKYWFIKWLVDNDKIDKKKVFSFIDTADKPYEDILCLLALSDSPVTDLISYLK